VSVSELERRADQILDGVGRKPLNLAMRNEAKNIFAAADLIEREVGKALKRAAGHDERIALLQAVLVLTGYGLELLMKLIAIIDDDAALTLDDLRSSNRSIPNGHNLLVIYDKLPDQWRAKIADTYSRFDRAVDAVEAVRQKLGAIGAEPFYEWRYLYESTDRKYIDFQALKTLRDVLTAAIESHKSTNGD
jgi:hypothetical protein